MEKGACIELSAKNDRLKWITEGADLTAMIPILSAYMGHAGIRSAAQYLRLTAEVYPELMKQIEETCAYVIPEVAYEGN